MSYSPAPGRVEIVAFDSLLLSVSVDPDQDFSTTFTLGDSIVGTGPEYMVHGDRLGTEVYEATVNAGKYWFDTDWTVVVVSDSELPTPPPTSPVAEPGPLPGTVRVRWDRPPDRLVETPLDAYEIAWSPAPFGEEEFPLQNIVRVADVPGSIRQSEDLNVGGERQDFWFRIRSIDDLGRVSPATVLITSESTGSFDLSGHVQAIDGSGLPFPVGSVLVEVGGRLVVTGTDGAFSVLNLPDLLPLSVRIEEGSGLYYERLLTHPLDPVDRALEVVLVPTTRVEILQNNVIVDDIPLAAFVLDALAHQLRVPPFEFHPWKQYPVKVWVWNHTQDGTGVSGGDLVSYHDAFQRGVDLWNTGTMGEDRLLEIVWVDESFDPTTDPSLEGVFYRADFPAQGDLGRVSYVRPSGGSIGSVDPELLRIDLRAEFNFQDVADRIIAHELGHCLGLIHTESEDDLMHATSSLSLGVPRPEEVFAARFLRYGGPGMRADWFTDQ